MDQITIRKYLNSDFDAIVAQMNSLQAYFVDLDNAQEQKPFVDLNDASLYMMQAIKDAEEMDGVIYVAESSNQIKGFIQGVIVKHSDDVMHKLTHNQNVEGWIGLLFTDSEIRGTGIGRKLVNTIEQYFKEKGCTSMRLKVANNNGLAIGMYTKYGFRPRDLEMAIEIK